MGPWGSDPLELAWGSDPQTISDTYKFNYFSVARTPQGSSNAWKISTSVTWTNCLLDLGRPTYAHIWTVLPFNFSKHIINIILLLLLKGFGRTKGLQPEAQVINQWNKGCGGSVVLYQWKSADITNTFFDYQPQYPVSMAPFENQFWDPVTGYRKSPKQHNPEIKTRLFYYYDLCTYPNRHASPW